MVVMKSFAKCALVLLGVVLFAACGGGSDSNGINNDTDYELYEPEVYDAEENNNDDDNDTETTSNQTLPPTIQTPTVISQEPNDEVPFLWLVTAPHGQTMYIFGTIHYGNPDFFPLPIELMRAFRRSDFLATERLIFEDFPQWIHREPLVLENYMSQERIRELHQQAMAILDGYEDYVLEMMGVALDELYDLDINALNSIIGSIVFAKSGASNFYGMEMFFTREALSRHIPILGIEDGAAIDERMLNMSSEIIIRQLEYSYNVGSISEQVEIHRESMRRWRSGDEQWLLATTNYMFEILNDDELAAELRYILFDSRDGHMADRASEFMAEGKKVFFMVGAAHLLVENNVLEQLAQRGYAIERIR